MFPKKVTPNKAEAVIRLKWNAS